MTDSARKIVLTFYKEIMAQDVLDMMQMVHADVMYGSDAVVSENTVYPGFESGLAVLQTFADQMARELWVDIACDDIHESEPTGYYEDDLETGERVWIEGTLEDVVYYDRKAIVQAVFGPNLAPYID